MRFDLVILGGRIIDGRGTLPYRADIGIQGDRITAIEPNLEAESKQTIDASGLMVCPGFIDTHVHSDVMLLQDKQHAAGLLQGITTEVLGQDGMSYAPTSPQNLKMYARYLAGLNGYPDIDWNWSSVAQYRARFDRTVAVNTVYMLPHSNIRLETVGFNDVPLQSDNLKRAKDLIRQGFDEGAVAFSTGLSYYPGSYCDTEELVELSNVVAQCGGFYVTHYRTVFRDKPFDPVLEAIEIGERSGAPVHFSHYRTGPNNLGQTETIVAPLEAAIQRGLEVTAELYPYPGGSSHGFIFFPPWSHEGGTDEILERLADPETRKRIAQDYDRTLGSWHRIRFSNLPSGKNNDLIGRTVGEVAEERNMKGEDLLCDFMLGEGLQVGFVEVPSTDEAIWQAFDKDILTLLSKPYYMVGSDSIPIGQKPHPRGYGCFARVLRLQREHPEMISLESIIQHLTSIPAKRFGLKDRGTLKLNKAADIVIFDAHTIIDTATYEKPKSYAKGIEYVLVNGELAVDKGNVTGKLAGRALPS
jgi:N-acyl-D-amino-acid deacylase